MAAALRRRFDDDAQPGKAKGHSNGKVNGKVNGKAE